MKIALCLVFAGAALGWTGCATSESAHSATPRGGQVRVTFDHPEQFTDVKTRLRDGTDEQLLEQLRNYLASVGGAAIPAGSTLTITFTDFDMAGEFEPWHVTTTDIRMIESIYAPRAKFTWTLTDASGAVVRQGTENLVDPGFMSRSNSGGEALFYEKGMLRMWLRRTFS